MGVLLDALGGALEALRPALWAAPALGSAVPAFFLPTCVCCGSQVECGEDETFATLPSGWTTHTRDGSASPVPTYGVSGGRLRSTETELADGSRGSFYHARAVGALSTPRLTLSAKCWANHVSGYQGIFLGPRVLYSSTFGSACYRQNCDEEGDVTAADPATGTSLGSAFSDGDTLAIVAEQVAVGEWDFSYQRNGTEIGTESSVSWSPTDGEFTVGVWSHNGGQWDDWELVCGNGVTTGCPYCTSAPTNWEVEIAPVTLGPIGFTCPTCTDNYEGTWDLGHWETYYGDRIPPIQLSIEGGQGTYAGCMWRSAVGPGCPASPGGDWPRYYLRIAVTVGGVGGPAWALFAIRNNPPVTPLILAVWAGQSVGCLSPIVLTRTYQRGECTFPATVTITPA